MCGKFKCAMKLDSKCPRIWQYDSMWFWLTLTKNSSAAPESLLKASSRLICMVSRMASSAAMLQHGAVCRFLCSQILYIIYNNFIKIIINLRRKDCSEFTIRAWTGAASFLCMPTKSNELQLKGHEKMSGTFRNKEIESTPFAGKSGTPKSKQGLKRKFAISAVDFDFSNFEIMVLAQ